MDPQSPSRFSLNRHPRWLQWTILLVLSLIFAGLFDSVRLPAALLLGSMFAAILVAVANGAPKVTRTPFVLAQGIVGCLVARGLTAEIMVSLHDNWPLFVSVTVMVILACAGMGWLLARRQVLPGTTAIWGCWPGGAAAMMLMADAYGADIRQVAIMQYLRVVIVTVLATVVAHFWMGGAHPDHGVFSNWFDHVSVTNLGLTLLLAFSASLLANFIRMPAGPLLGPLIVGSILQIQGLIHITLPPWILMPAYITLGWCIGLRFTHQALSQAMRSLPLMMAAIIGLVLACGGIAAGLTIITDVDPLTAYLATSPGGLDSVAIIAATAGVNIPFVMAFQTARLLLVLLVGPALARFMSKKL